MPANPGVINNGVISKWLSSKPSVTQMLTVDADGNVGRQAIPSAPTPAWGNITGTLSAQTDLQMALDNKAPFVHGHAIGDVTNLSSTLTAIDIALAALDAAKLNTSAFTFANLGSKPTTLSGYGITDAQPVDTDLTAIAALTTQPYGRSLLTQSDAGAARTTLGLGSLATQNGTISDYLLSATAASTYLPLTGGTLTGGLSGTTISASGEIRSSDIGRSSGNRISIANQLWQFSMNGSDEISFTQQGGTDSWGVCTRLGGFAAGALPYGDVKWVRDAANIWAQRFGANAQTLRIYGTYTDPGNYRRLYISSTTGGAFTLGVEGLGTGASGNTLAVANSLSVTAVALGAGQYETPLRLGVSDTSDNFSIQNNTATAGRFCPDFVGEIVGAHNSRALGFVGVIPTGQDSGSNPVVVFDAWKGSYLSGTALTTRPSFAFQNFGTTLVTISSGGRITTPSILLSGNFSAPAWTTDGVGIAHTARTLTDTSSTGTVAAAYTNVLGGNTVAASNATTYTEYASLFIGNPTAGANVAITNPFSLITAGSVRCGGNVTISGSVGIGGVSALSASHPINLPIYTWINWAGSAYLTADPGIGLRLNNCAIQNITWLGLGSSNDLKAERDAANVWAQRNALNSQTWRLYNTFSDTGNYIRQALSFTTYSTVVHAQWLAEGLGTGAVNIPIVISPRGTGAFILGPMPDGTATGGNARGANAIDLQIFRNSATQVASGLRAIAFGNRCTASGQDSISIGSNCFSPTADTINIGRDCSGVLAGNGTSSIAIGVSCNAGGTNSIAMGLAVSGTTYLTFGFGRNTILDRPCSFGWSPGSFGQSNQYMLGQVTTNNTPTTLFLRSVFSSTDRLTLRSGVTWYCNALITGSRSDGLVNATFQRQFSIRRVGNTTTLVGTVNTVGIDEAAGTSVAITADDVNEALQIEVTGISGETWRWNALVFVLEQTFGT